MRIRERPVGLAVSDTMPGAGDLEALARQRQGADASSRLESLVHPAILVGQHADIKREAVGNEHGSIQPPGKRLGHFVEPGSPGDH
ncbi:MAG: hypothetical protein Kow00129_10550 [Thermoleophilia bacterium]